jgi:hypothetical protein
VRVPRNHPGEGENGAQLGRLKEGVQVGGTVLDLKKLTFSIKGSDFHRNMALIAQCCEMRVHIVFPDAGLQERATFPHKQWLWPGWDANPGPLTHIIQRHAK